MKKLLIWWHRRRLRAESRAYFSYANAANCGQAMLNQMPGFVARRERVNRRVTRLIELGEEVHHLYRRS